MRSLLMPILMLILPAGANGGTDMSCDFFVYGEVPFITIKLNVRDDQHIEPTAQVTQYGARWTTQIRENQIQGNQIYNLTVDAHKPGQEIFMEIYNRQASGSDDRNEAKLINPQSPAGKEMAGYCVTSAH